MSSEIRVRFAPSPTGYLHVGGARTALFNYLFARHVGGTFILRIEDTDRSRYQPGAEKEIFESLRWLGLNWDEGPETGGACGPYVQSERTDLYVQSAADLLTKGAAYRCFCTPERLEKTRNEREKAKQPGGYDRHCRDLPQAQIDKLLAEGTRHVVRFKMPVGRKVVFNDLIRGQIEYNSDLLDDLVLLKGDRFPTYHLANVTDDHAMKISHVMRADEWIASTPSHILMYEAFGWTPPVFAHLPVVLDPNGGKLSKRKGAASVMDFQKMGILPESLFNFLALLGWSPGDDREIMTREEMIAAFTLEKISPKGSVLDEKKLEWMNGVYLAKRTVESIAPEVIGAWKAKGVVDAVRDEADPYLMSVIAMLKDRSKRIGDIVEGATYFFVDPVVYDDKASRKYFTRDVIPLLKEASAILSQSAVFDHASLEAVYRLYAEQHSLQGGALIHPTRLAVSGTSVGPGLFEMLELLGKETVVRRIGTAVAWIEKNIGVPT